MGKIGVCRWCSKEKNLHAKGFCKNCYTYHGTPKVICKSCGELRNHHANGLCRRCDRRRYIEYTRNLQISKEYPLHLYREKTKKCFLCGFNTIVELHHSDGDHKNNQSNNLIGLCPNHHKMSHMLKHKDQINQLIKEKLGKNGN